MAAFITAAAHVFITIHQVYRQSHMNSRYDSSLCQGIIHHGCRARLVLLANVLHPRRRDPLLFELYSANAIHCGHDILIVLTHCPDAVGPLEGALWMEFADRILVAVGGPPECSLRRQRRQRASLGLGSGLGLG